MNKTANFDLPQWEKSDFIQMDDFNDLTQKLDAAIKQTADAAASTESVAEIEESMNSLTQMITKSKVCRIKYGSYTGDGRYSSGSPIGVSCDFYPVAMFIDYEGVTVSVLRGKGGIYAPTSQSVLSIVTWNDTGLNWYSANSAKNHFNTEGKVYYYVLIGYDNS